MLSHLPARPAKIAKPVSVASELPPAPPTVLHFDGSCKPNPGPMGIGYELNTVESRVLVRVGAQIGQGTNNEAEYQAFIAGLRHALRLGLWDLRAVSDSLLVVNQMKGQWGVKDKGLARLFREATVLASLFRTFEIEHTRREGNAAADELSRLMVFQEPELPPLPLRQTSRHPRGLYDWQAAAVRYWWINKSPGAGTLSRILGVVPSLIEQIGYGKTYRDAGFDSYPGYLYALRPA